MACASGTTLARRNPISSRLRQIQSARERLMARASLLLDQGNIGVARTVLERAAEMGSASALFALAETYDPAMLAAWRTFRTQGDAGQAPGPYAKAVSGRIRAAEAPLPEPR